MTEQDKQTLIEHIETCLECLKNVALKYSDECEHDWILRDIQVQEIALAALTAQPVGYLRAGEANLLNRLKQHEVVEAALFRTMSFRDDVPVFTQSSSSFGLTREERDRIVRCVDSLCRRIPGSNFINAAELTIDEMTNKKAGK